MVNRSYRIGYNFERRVRKMFEDNGFLVIRSGKSRFPDGIAVTKVYSHPQNFPKVVIFECKVNKYLSKEEKLEAHRIFELTGLPLTVYYRKDRKLLSYEVS